MAYKEVILHSPDGFEGIVLYDTSRELLIFNYMTTAAAKKYGYTWRDKEQTDGKA